MSNIQNSSLLQETKSLKRTNKPISLEELNPCSGLTEADRQLSFNANLISVEEISWSSSALVGLIIGVAFFLLFILAS